MTYGAPCGTISLSKGPEPRDRKGKKTMTQKDLIMIASNSEMMAMLAEIADIQKNMCHKTIYEQKTAKAKMKEMAKEIIENLH